MKKKRQHLFGLSGPSIGLLLYRGHVCSILSRAYPLHPEEVELGLDIIDRLEREESDREFDVVLSCLFFDDKNGNMAHAEVVCIKDIKNSLKKRRNPEWTWNHGDWIRDYSISWETHYHSAQRSSDYYHKGLCGFEFLEREKKGLQWKN